MIALPKPVQMKKRQFSVAVSIFQSGIKSGMLLLLSRLIFAISRAFFFRLAGGYKTYTGNSKQDSENSFHQ